MITIDTTGDVCPVPVIKTKKAMEQTHSKEILVIVDNEIAMNNVRKMAMSLGAEVMVEKINDTKIHVMIHNRLDATQNTQDEKEEEKFPNGNTENIVVAISSDKMGDGDEQLGHILMKGFLFAMSQLEELPKTILFYNSGAFLTAKDSESLSDLQFMEQQGVEILTCGTCLDFYGKKEQLGVGTVTNMYQMVEIMTKADKIIRP